MPDKHPLEDYCGPMPTRMGQAFPGQRTVFRGKDLHQDLQQMSWLELYLFGITGRNFTPQQLHVLDMVWQVTSYPEPRIWNNRIAALAGSARATSTQALSAACAGTEAQLFGLQVQHMCGDFLFRTREQLLQGRALKDILAKEISLHKYIKGYGRPIAAQDQDERIPAIFQVMQAAGIEHGEYTRLVFQVEQSLTEMGMPLRPNYAVFASAIPMDLGLSVKELICYLYTVVLAGMPPLYLEALERPEGATFPMKCAQINYTGVAHRNWEPI